MITISLCMIVKNEENVLERCLDTVADLMDEIIIVDTGSTDRTKEIAAKYTDKIYDFAWIKDFSAARNFSFSKATMEYIYAPDADEILDEENRERFRVMKECLLSEIEMVQMKYVTENEENSVMNAKKEYRPKLFKRQRTFTWIDPVHETVRLNPVVYNSDIEILHKPEHTHQKRDFSIFTSAYKRDGMLSDKLMAMYAKELLKLGEPQDFLEAKEIFEQRWMEAPLGDNGKEAACILARNARYQDMPNELFKYALRDMMENPCSEICYELGEYYKCQKDYDEAIVWYYNAAYETTSIIDIRTGGDLPLKGLVECYEELMNHIDNDDNIDNAKNSDSKRVCEELLDRYRRELLAWKMPEDLDIREENLNKNI